MIAQIMNRTFHIVFISDFFIADLAGIAPRAAKLVASDVQIKYFGFEDNRFVKQRKIKKQKLKILFSIVRKILMKNTKKIKIAVMILTCMLLVSACGNEKKDPSLTQTQAGYKNEDKIKSSKNSYVKLVDNYFDDEAITILYSDVNACKNLKAFNNTMNSEFDFYEISFQSYQSLNYYTLEDKFIRKYGREKNMVKNQEILIKNKECFVTSLNTIQVNQNAHDEFLNKIIKGRGFNREDFKYEFGDRVPIVLGYEYQEYYDIGDIIELNHLERNTEFEVIGFFDVNTSIKIDNQEYLLDTYICSPYFNIEKEPVDEEDGLYQMRYYLQRNVGYIKYSGDIPVDIDIYDNEILQDYEQWIMQMSAQNELDYSILSRLFTIQ